MSEEADPSSSRPSDVQSRVSVGDTDDSATDDEDASASDSPPGGMRRSSKLPAAATEPGSSSSSSSAAAEVGALHERLAAKEAVLQELYGQLAQANERLQRAEQEQAQQKRTLIEKLIKLVSTKT